MAAAPQPTPSAAKPATTPEAAPAADAAPAGLSVVEQLRARAAAAKAASAT
jgi:hypothetical protein